MLHDLSRLLNPSLFWEYRIILLRGLAVNMMIFAAAGVLAAALAIFIGLCRLSRHRLLRALSTGFAELFRNTPELVLVVWVYYVLPIFISRALGQRFELSPWLAAVLALGFAYSGFMAETVRAGVLSVPHGHVEAAMSVGMTRFTILRRIVLPQAVRRMLPEALNQFVSLFKATSIVSLIAVPDIMYQVSMINVQEMQPMPLYTGAALLFCVAVISATQIIHRLSDRWRRRGWA
jgi:polar amino acid transport system permease protein